jgi:hypothetical protein
MPPSGVDTPRCTYGRRGCWPSWRSAAATVATYGAFEQLGQDLWAPLETSGALAGLAHLYVIPDGWLRLPPASRTVSAWSSTRCARVPLCPGSTRITPARCSATHIAEAATRAQTQPGALAAVLDPARAAHPVWPPAVQTMRDALAPQVALEGAIDHAAFAEAINTAGGLLYFGHGTVGGLVPARRIVQCRGRADSPRPARPGATGSLFAGAGTRPAGSGRRQHRQCPCTWSAAPACSARCG